MENTRKLKKILVDSTIYKKMNIMAINAEYNGKEPEVLGRVVEKLVGDNFDKIFLQTNDSKSLCICGCPMSQGMDKDCAERFSKFQETEDKGFYYSHSDNESLPVVIQKNSKAVLEKNKDLFDIVGGFFVYRNTEGEWGVYKSGELEMLKMHEGKVINIDIAIQMAKKRIPTETEALREDKHPEE